MIARKDESFCSHFKDEVGVGEIVRKCGVEACTKYFLRPKLVTGAEKLNRLESLKIIQELDDIRVKFGYIFSRHQLRIFTPEDGRRNYKRLRAS